MVKYTVYEVDVSAIESGNRIIRLEKVWADGYVLF